MKIKSMLLMLVLFVLGANAMSFGQTVEVKFEAAQPKITTVSAMRARRSPVVAGEEIMRLKLGTVVSATGRSTDQDTVAGKTDYWYRVNLPNGESGWVFGGLLLDYNSRPREELLKQIIEDRLKAEKTEFADRQEIYNLAASSVTEAKDANTRVEFELLKLLALANWAGIVPNEQKNKSPYREFLAGHKTELIENEFGGGYDLRSETLWNLETKYHTLPIADRIAWEAARNEQPSDCESDQVCAFFLFDGDIKYLNTHPAGAHTSEALQNLNEVLTDEVIQAANARGGDKYAVQQGAEVRKSIAALRLALAKVSSAEKAGLVKKVGRVK